MRSMRKMCGIAGVVAALGAFGGTSASAATIGPGGTAFTGANNGEQWLTIVGNIRVRCNQVRLAGTTPSPATSSTPFAVTYGAATGVSGSWCRLYSGANFTPATVATSGNWTLSANTFDALTGASTGAITTGGTTTITTTLASCVITLPSGTVLGTTGQNWVGGGIAETVGQYHIAYTASSSCAGFGIAASGFAAGYDGVLNVADLSVS